ncbi:NUDIX hydrolase [Tropicimonas sp. S265A]|uniref:NUDIX hydrolase n=1 Tax=Tropicimonas sp. S265A TaxID=3415134 RepID=UPI003C7CC1E5
MASLRASEIQSDSGARTQVAALPYVMDRGKPRVLLITSRETRRWVIPKGWPMKGLSAPEAARIEAWEEAGIVGKVSDTCLGFYAYHKSLAKADPLPIVVAVYPLRVKALKDKYPEVGQRRRKWMSCKRAAERVDEPELRKILRKFDGSPQARQ